MKKSLKFPDGFYWGAATASYQVEGGIYNNDWARAAKTGKVPEAGSATDHYNRYEEDFDLAKTLGHNAQRISIEWSRIEPREGEFNQAEIEHYRKVLMAMIRRGMKPFVTLWHFTLPEWFVDRGGFEARDSAKIFARYSEFVVNELGDLCKDWATMNEPMVFVMNGYIRHNWPPFKINPIASEIVFINLVRAHIQTYKKIKKIDKTIRVSIVKDNFWFTSDWKPWNLIAKWASNWYWNHRIMILTAPFTDSIGLNFYFAQNFGKQKKFEKNDMGWDLNAEGIYHVLKDLKIYRKPIYISEAGIADREDKHRAEYLKDLVHWMHHAIEDGVDVRGFMYWSLLDNYEWSHGYTQNFGLIKVDSKTKERKVRKSAYIYKKICDDNALTLE